MILTERFMSNDWSIYSAPSKCACNWRQFVCDLQYEPASQLKTQHSGGAPPDLHARLQKSSNWVDSRKRESPLVYPETRSKLIQLRGPPCTFCPRCFVRRKWPLSNQQHLFLRRSNPAQLARSGQAQWNSLPVILVKVLVLRRNFLPSWDSFLGDESVVDSNGLDWKKNWKQNH